MSRAHVSGHAKTLPSQGTRTSHSSALAELSSEAKTQAPIPQGSEEENSWSLFLQVCAEVHNLLTLSKGNDSNSKYVCVCMYMRVFTQAVSATCYTL